MKEKIKRLQDLMSGDSEYSISMEEKIIADIINNIIDSGENNLPNMIRLNDYLSPKFKSFIVTGELDISELDKDEDIRDWLFIAENIEDYPSYGLDKCIVRRMAYAILNYAISRSIKITRIDDNV